MTSEQTNEIAAALAKAQGIMQNAKLNKINPHFKSKYADLASIIDAIKEPLAANGIGYTQMTLVGETSLMLLTKLLHVSGQWIDSEYPLPLVPDKPQVLGSALTYARRYELAAICGIAAEEDTDAEGVAEAVGATRKPPKPAPDIVKPTPLPADAEPESPNGIDVEDMAREAAMRGAAVMKQFYNSRSDADKAKIKLIKPELDKLVDDADKNYSQEGS